ncbi:MAG: hypothetical protein EBU90_23490, partial [Proteobacteria bacterium]|nr:hypothetical protein [Pseudomonadota bacterium]
SLSLGDTNKILIDQLKLQAEQNGLLQSMISVLQNIKPQNIIAGGQDSQPTPPSPTTFKNSRELYQRSPYYVSA